MYKTWNKTTKAKWLKIAKEHRDADRFMQGKWIQEGKGEKGMHRGCFFGCMMQTENGALEKATEIMKLPDWIVYVSERIFEGLPKEEAKEFTVQLLESIPCNKDTEQIWKDWNYTVLMDEKHGQYKYCVDNTDCKDAVENCAALFKIDFMTKSAAESAAWSAAESAADSAAWSAAWSARSAAWSARSAESAESENYQWLRDTLITLLAK